jgi:hypothetical protein
MRRLLILLVCVLCGAVTVSAQSTDCGQGLPCGPVPWKLPVLPKLSSPTPIPTVPVTLQPPNTPGPTPTPQPTPTFQPIGINTVDASGIADKMATLSAVIEATPELVLNASGTPVALEDAALDSGAETLFAYAKGLGSINLGSISPVVTFSVTAAMLIIATKLITFILPVLVALFGIIRKIIQLILDFLPFSILVIPIQAGTLTPWPTPTLRTYAEATPAFNIPAGAPIQIAEEIIQGYHFANQSGALDTIVVIAMLFLVIGGIWTILVKVRDL